MERRRVEQRADLAQRRPQRRYGRPPTSAVPASGASRPRITRIVVDLPAPFGPTNPVTWPGCDGERQAVDGHGRARSTCAGRAPRSLPPCGRYGPRARRVVTPRSRLARSLARGTSGRAARPEAQCRCVKPLGAGAGVRSARCAVVETVLRADGAPPVALLLALCAPRCRSRSCAGTRPAVAAALIAPPRRYRARALPRPTPTGVVAPLSRGRLVAAGRCAGARRGRRAETRQPVREHAAGAHRARRAGPHRPRAARRGRPPHLDDLRAGRDRAAWPRPGMPAEGAERLLGDRRHRAHRADRDAPAARRAARGRRRRADPARRSPACSSCSS